MVGRILGNVKEWEKKKVEVNSFAEIIRSA